MAALTGAVFLQFTQLEGYDFLTDLYAVQGVHFTQAGHHHVRVWTLLSLVASGLMFFTGALGWVSQATRSLTGTSAFNLLAVLLAIFFLARVSTMYTLRPLLMSVVDRELAEWCGYTSRIVYSAELKCEHKDWMDDFPKSELMECGPECQSRVEILRELGGCEYLERICDDLQFVFAGNSVCETADLAGQLVPAPTLTSSLVTTQQCCTFACAQQAQACRAYSFEVSKKVLDWHGGQQIKGICSLVRVFPPKEAESPPSVVVPTVPPVPTLPPAPALPTLPPTLPPPTLLPELKPLEPRLRRLEPSKEAEEASEAARLYDCVHPVSFSKNSTFSSVRRSWPHPMIIENMEFGHRTTPGRPGSTMCMAKGKPTFLYQVLSCADMGGNLAAVDFVLLLLAFSSGLQYAYSLATKRRGRKGLCAMFGVMLLPCLSRHTNRTRKLVHDKGDFLAAGDISASESSDSSLDMLR